MIRHNAWSFKNQKCWIPLAWTFISDDLLALLYKLFCMTHDGAWAANTSINFCLCSFSLDISDFRNTLFPSKDSDSCKIVQNHTHSVKRVSLNFLMIENVNYLSTNLSQDAGFLFLLISAFSRSHFISFSATRSSLFIFWGQLKIEKKTHMSVIARAMLYIAHWDWLKIYCIL